MLQSIRKEKLKKSGLCFVTDCFIKPFEMINNFFYFSSSFAAQFSIFEIRDIKRRNWERQIARNGKFTCLQAKLTPQVSIDTPVNAF